MVQWEVDLVGGSEIPNHPVSGTRRYTARAHALDTKGRKLAEVSDVEVKSNRMGVFIDVSAVMEQVGDEELGRLLINRIKETVRGLAAETRRREYRVQLSVEDGLAWQNDGAEADSYRDKIGEQIERKARQEGYETGDRIIVWANDIGELASWRLEADSG